MVSGCGRLVALALLGLFAAGCGEKPASKMPPKTMTEQQTAATRPLCVGRFLIDVPADAKVVWTSTGKHATREMFEWGSRARLVKKKRAEPT